MKLRIEGNEYRLSALEDMGLLDLLKIKQQTGKTLEDIKAAGDRMRELGADAGDAVLSDEDLLIAFGIMVWVARRKAGEDITFEQAVDVPFRNLEFIAELGDESPEA